MINQALGEDFASDTSSPLTNQSQIKSIGYLSPHVQDYPLDEERIERVADALKQALHEESFK